MVITLLYPSISAWLYEFFRDLQDPIFLGYQWNISWAMKMYTKEFSMSNNKEDLFLYLLAVSFPLLVNQLAAMKMLWVNYFSNPSIDGRTQRVVFFNYIVLGMILIGVPSIGALLFFVDDVWIKSIYLTWGIVPYLFFYYLYQPLSKIAGVIGFLITALWFFSQA